MTTTAGRRVAVVGAGPAGIYAAKAAATCPDVSSIDVFDLLPTPYGLVRYGVAPDHPKTKLVARALERDLTHEKVRFLGNVRVGTDVSREELATHYDATVFSTGARRDRDLGIPGDDLPGSYGAAEFVSWYSGHPDTPLTEFIEGSTAAVVVGGGNVALDVARLLARDPEDLCPTDIPEHVLVAFRNSAITDVHVLLRRGPQHARFTPVELRELGELPDVDVVFEPGALAGVDALDGLPRQTQQNLSLMRTWADRPDTGARRRIHFHFWTNPVCVSGSHRVTAVHTLSTGPTGSDQQHEVTIPAGLLLRAIGYAADPIKGLPFDQDKAVVPNDQGRVIDADGAVREGAYVAGWLKRGPSGVIGTNRADAAETVEHLVTDLPSLARCAVPDSDALIRILRSRGVQVVDWQGWQALESHERSLGPSRSATAIKVHERAQMLKIAAREGR